jgi:hypothetical protein
VHYSTTSKIGFQQRLAQAARQLELHFFALALSRFLQGKDRLASGESGSQTHDFQAFHLKLPKILSVSRVRFRLGDCGDKSRMDRACCRAPADLFLPANVACPPAGISAGIGSNR